MHDYIKERAIKIGEYFIETKDTVRKIANKFGVSKSTVHKDLTERLPYLDSNLANKVKNILEYHKSIRHIRGGEATKIKYKFNTSRGKVRYRRTGIKKTSTEKVLSSSYS